MNPTDTLTTLFKHHLWANLRLLDHCSVLTDEQLDATIPGAQGSMLETMRHMVGSEKHYYSRISTGQRYQGPEDAPPMTMGEMVESARKTGSGLVEWATKVQPGDIVMIDWDGTPREVPKTIILTQVINHATEHREQVKAIMTQIGIEPPDLSGWTYFDELDR